MGAPAIVVISPAHAEDLSAAFARYQHEYHVRLVSEEKHAQDVARAILEDGDQVALFVIDTDQPEDQLYALIQKVRKVVPTARRLVVAHVSRFRADAQTFRHAVAAGKVDALLLMPQGARDEEFQGAVGEMLNDWNATVATPEFESVQVVSPERDPLTRSLLDYLGRIGIPVGLHHPDSDVGRSPMARCY